MKELVIFDVDGTIVNGQSQKLLIEYLLSIGYISRIFYIKLIIWFLFYRIGLLKNPAGAMKYAYSFLNKKTVEEVASVTHNFVEDRLKKVIYSEAVDLIKEHQQNGRQVILVSNAPAFIIKEIANLVDTPHYICTTLEIINGLYTGNILNIVYGDKKVEVVKDFIEENDFNLNDTWAYGDHPSDEPLLSLVRHPVVVNPSGNLRALASLNHWPILTLIGTPR